MWIANFLCKAVKSQRILYFEWAECPKLTEAQNHHNKCPCGSLECNRDHPKLCILQFQWYNLHFRGSKIAGLSPFIWVYIRVSNNNYETLNFWWIPGPKESSNKCHYCLRLFLPQPQFNPRDHPSELQTWGVASLQKMLKFILNHLIYDVQKSCQTGLPNIEFSEIKLRYPDWLQWNIYLWS